MSVWAALRNLRFAFRRRLTKTVRIRDSVATYVFQCQESLEALRARTLLIKEEGTVAWIQSEVRNGDVFYDIGANIGLYSIMAGYRVGATGMVYAFEPHAANFSSLLRNISSNALTDRVTPISSALHNAEGYFDFNYYAWEAGSSTSQLASATDDRGRPFKPACRELKHGVTVDHLVAGRAIREPALIKIDVDGNELLVLQGMINVLGSVRPRAVQVEMNILNGSAIVDFMGDLGFQLADRHYTLAGKKQLKRGVNQKSIPYNAIFRPV